MMLLMILLLCILIYIYVSYGCITNSLTLNDITELVWDLIT